jgi:hypothetical protein
MDTTPASTSVTASQAPRIRRLNGILALVGALLIAVQVWAYGTWLLGSPEPLRSPTPVPADVTSTVRRAELTSIVGATVWLLFVCWDWARRRTLTWPLLWTVAWACVFWQEPLVNARTHTFSFNRGFHNLGDWTTHIPFVPDSYSPLPEALVLEGLVFLYLLPLLAMAVAAFLRVVRRRLGISNPIALVLIAYLAVVVFDAAFEVQGVQQGLLRYVELGGPAVGAGEPEQWPILEGFAIGAAWAFPGILTYFLRDHRAQHAERPAPRWRAGRHGAAVTLLAAIGMTNVVFGLYNAGYIAVMKGTVSEQPVWLAPGAPVLGPDVMEHRE